MGPTTAEGFILLNAGGIVALLVVTALAITRASVAAGRQNVKLAELELLVAQRDLHIAKLEADLTKATSLLIAVTLAAGVNENEETDLVEVIKRLKGNEK